MTKETVVETVDAPTIAEGDAKEDCTNNADDDGDARIDCEDTDLPCLQRRLLVLVVCPKTRA